jgi:GTPase
VINSPTSSRRHGNDEIIPEAHKVITFMDLAGHERYLKTTMFGLTGGAPDYAMLMVGANAGLIGMAKEHLAMTFALSTPVMVVVTKIDMSPPNILEGTIRQLQKVLKSPSARRTPMMIKSPEDVIVASRNFVTQRLCPIFQVSNVTGEGIDHLKNFLHLLPQGAKYGAAEAPAEFQITDTYVVPGVGTVVAGTMISGTVSLGQTLYLGPDSLGNFLSCQIKGVQRKRVTVPKVYAGQCASLALKKIKRSMIRKGMVVVGKELAIQPPPESHSCREFEAEVVILFHSTTIGPRYQAMLHCGVVRQTVSLVSMQSEVLRTGDRALVRFRFMRFPEYLKVGARLLFREGRTKGVGKITALYE